MILLSKNKIFFFNILFILIQLIKKQECFLKPVETSTRQIKSLNGLWKFILTPELGINISRSTDEMKPINDFSDYILMPVPSSFNDITQNHTIRDYVGWYWYETKFVLTKNFFNSEIAKTTSLFINFGSVNYYCEVYVNNHLIGNHSGGHLPFEFKINVTNLHFDKINVLKLGSNNILDLFLTIPESESFKAKNTTDFIYPKDYIITKRNFDFFNYAGIHRDVVIYTKNVVSVNDIDISFQFHNESVFCIYTVLIDNYSPQFVYKILFFDNNDQLIFTDNNLINRIIIINPNLWWPYSISNKKPYLYKFQVEIYDNKQNLLDQVWIRTGIRSIEIKDKQLFLNLKKIYLTGFGKHEDLNIKGRGFDLVYALKDFNLIRWIGANSFRTSHYPYSEEILDLADEYGILIIDECPAVCLANFNDEKLKIHKQMLNDLIKRDKNHPSVIAWSIANEPNSDDENSDQYFKELINYTKKLDSSRPIAAALNKNIYKDNLAKYLDLIMLNKYFSWYSLPGELDLIYNQINFELKKWLVSYEKPIMISEYGADTISGLHQNPSSMFSEDYQSEYLLNHFKAFDYLRKTYKNFIGEHYWNFADFMTKQTYTRVLGNRKGLFTRERQPKAAGKVIRCRYNRLINEFSGTKFEIDNEMYC